MEDKGNKTNELRAMKLHKNSTEKRLTSYTELIVSTTGYSQYKSGATNYWNICLSILNSLENFVLCYYLTIFDGCRCHNNLSLANNIWFY